MAYSCLRKFICENEVRAAQWAALLRTPDSEDAVLLWSAEEEYPMATAEQEYLYQGIFR